MKKKPGREVVLDLFLFAVGIVFISLFYRNNLLVTALLFLSWLVGLKWWHTREDVVLFVAGGVIGPVAEIVAISFGVWQYAYPAFLGIPPWLPLAWGFAVLGIKRVAEAFVTWKL